MSLSRIMQEDRRLCVLRLLHEDSDYSLNSSLLGKALAAYGHGISGDQLRTDLAWLAEQDLITLQDLPRPGGRDPLQVATLTGRGADVAEGRAKVPGVARPTPGH
ncbi:ArsR family transcriptional regulator [Telmatospirillum sp. J64-1]|uniref:VpaChn25_0724 family phage protein n=1 Tax=Telmatospirillum sp. J64-1 TaxID=2502183 RepID=UPI00115E918E|nr:ArsR family transcriptional regulator [Telmatospirillum sp. J64-1]